MNEFSHALGSNPTTGAIPQKTLDWLVENLPDSPSGGEAGDGTTDHRALTNRDAANQHPIGAVTGLQAALDGKSATNHTHAPASIGAAAASHTHDDRYYTESEADGRFVRTVNNTGPDTNGNVALDDIAGGVAGALDPADPSGLTLLLTIPAKPSVELTLTKDGYKVTASWASSHPDGLSLTYEIDWGDGSAPVAATSPATKTYPSTLADYTITVTAIDSEGYTATDSETVTVSPPDVSAYGTAVLADNPVVYYPMGDSSLPVVDYMGNSTATTTGTLQDVDLGDTSRSLRVNDQNPGVNIGQPPELDDLTQFTFECLIRTNIPDEQGQMVYRGHAEGGFVQGIEVVWSKNSGIRFRRRMQGDPTVTSITLDFSTNDRLHVVGTYDAATGLRLYVNGVLQGQNTGAHGPLPGAGTSDWQFANYVWSNVAGVAIYDKVLDAARVQAHATAAGLY